MANLYKRGSNWWVRFRWRGQEVKQSTRTSSKSVAEQVLARILAEHRARDLDGQPRHTITDALSRFRAEYLPMLKPKTAKRYEVSLRQMRATFEHLYLDEVSKGLLANYASSRLRTGVTAATVRRDLNTLSAVMTCCVAWDWMTQNPVRQFSKKHLREAPPRTSFPSKAQIELLAAAASRMSGRIIRFLAATGMRQEEVCALEWGQVSLDRREVLLIRTKTNSPRVVPLGSDAMNVLAEVPRHSTSAFVFWHGDEGHRYTRFASIFVLVARKAGVPFRCHDLRHAFASEFLMATGDIGALQRILGHKTVSMTMRYAHLATRHLHQAMAEYDRAHTKTGTRENHPRENALNLPRGLRKT